jgi:hypothetical protein
VSKRPFDIDRALERIGEAVQPFPKAAMFEAGGRGVRLDVRAAGRLHHLDPNP